MDKLNAKAKEERQVQVQVQIKARADSGHRTPPSVVIRWRAYDFGASGARGLCADMQRKRLVAAVVWGCPMDEF